MDWRIFYDDRAPHEAELPEPWHSKLNDFQRLVVLRCIRPDKVRRRVHARTLTTLHRPSFFLYMRIQSFSYYPPQSHNRSSS